MIKVDIKVKDNEYLKIKRVQRCVYHYHRYM
jgi:hypothetical protein